MDIKINLKQLTQLFIQSAANEEIPPPIRQFAAQLTVLTAHLEREVQARQALATKLDGQIAELASAIIAVRPAVATPASAPTNGAPVEQNAPAEMDEDEAARAMAEEVQRETDAEVAAIAAKAITPIRQANSGQKEAS